MDTARIVWVGGLALSLVGCEGGTPLATPEAFSQTQAALVSGALTLTADNSISGYAAKEYCHVPQDVLTLLGSGVGRQLRVRTGSGASFNEGLCTVKQALDPGAGVVKMHSTGIARLDMAANASVVLTAMHGRATDRDGVTYHPGTETEAELDGMEGTKPNQIIERVADNGLNNTLIYTAPHGGNIEVQTAEQVEWIAPAATSKVSTWRVKGWYAGSLNARDHWHITSTDIDGTSFPGLGTVLGRDFKYAVSFHGYADTSYPAAGVLVGGGEAAVFREGVAEAIRDALRGQGLGVLHDPPVFAGAEPSNFVNELALGGRGIQIEQSNTTRTQHWQKVAEAVKAHYTCLIDTPAEDALTLAGTSQSAASDGTAYASTGCRMYALDVNVQPGPAGTTYSAWVHTSLVGRKGANCTHTELYTDLYKWSAASGRYHRVGGTRARGHLVANGNVCLVEQHPDYAPLTLQAPAPGAPPDQYRAVSWARFYGDPASFAPMPVTVGFDAP
ncbi:poly-gamma-glutamate hydrolase family protein [Myxococcus sp. Y35]|uniref:poly-gamma-glutamate hydrolase family protein n=1 Tax=Pseudomyxococcus flavus TaxID=3115648 RepID=UPI003CF46A52